MILRVMYKPNAKSKALVKLATVNIVLEGKGEVSWVVLRRI